MIKIKKIFFLILISFLLTHNTNAEIKDGLFMTIGKKAITKSDVVNEIKIILVLNNEGYSEEKRDYLHRLAVKSIIQRSVKENEIDKYQFYNYNKLDLEKELTRLANGINVDLDTFKNICASNELDFSLIEDNVKIELYWNSLIFELYKNKVTIDPKEIEEKLLSEKKMEEYLISEILIKMPQEDNLESEVEKIKNKIKSEGFGNVARTMSISESSSNAGDLGWLKKKDISKKVLKAITSTPLGEISKPVILDENILIFEVRDKRTVENKLSLEERKDLLVTAEKTKILNMYSLSHYDKLRRSISINYLQ